MTESEPAESRLPKGVFTPEGAFLVHENFSPEVLEATLDRLPFVAMIADRYGEWLYANSFARAALGDCSMEDVFETDVLKLGIEDSDARDSLPILKSAQSNEFQSLRDIEVSVRGQMRTFFVWAKPMAWDEKGDVDKVLVLFLRDNEQSAIEEVQKARMEATVATRAKNHFLANISHELRTPLTAVLGYLQLARADASAKALGHIELAREGATQLQGLINNILEVAKIEAEELELSTSRYNLRELVAMLESRFAPKAELKGLTFQVSVEDVSYELNGDRDKIEHILSALLDNAVKFTSHGQVSLLVSTIGGTLDIEVRDTGVGIADESQEHLFEPFQQKLDYQASHGCAAGLGLSICNSYVGLMAGTIEVQSELEVGSIFRVSLPVEGLTAAELQDWEDDDDLDDSLDDEDEDQRWEFLAEAVCALPVENREVLVDALLRADPVAFKHELAGIDLMPELVHQMEYLVNTYQYDEVLSLCRTSHTH